MICLTTGFIYLYAKSLLYGCKTQFHDSFLLYIHDQLLLSKMNIKGKILKKLGRCVSLREEELKMWFYQPRAGCSKLG